MSMKDTKKFKINKVYSITPFPRNKIVLFLCGGSNIQVIV